MERQPEPELMEDAAQARAYAEADFEEAHARFIALFKERFSAWTGEGEALDLGCGPADITVRFARAYPRCRVQGVDGAEAMLVHGRERIAREGLGGRIQLVQGYLPRAVLPRSRYEALISNSLLHHLAEPVVLWNAIKRHAMPGAPIFVMDLLRPADRNAALALVEEYAANEPTVLRHDFYHSLLAAYTIEEVVRQLALANLLELDVAQVSDRHWIATGYGS